MYHRTVDPIHPNFCTTSLAPPSPPFPTPTTNADDGHNRSQNNGTSSCSLLDVSRKLERISPLHEDEEVLAKGNDQAATEALLETVKQTATGKRGPLQVASPLHDSSGIVLTSDTSPRDTTTFEDIFNSWTNVTSEPSRTTERRFKGLRRRSVRNCSSRNSPSESTPSLQRHTFPRIRSAMHGLTSRPARMRSISVNDGQEETRQSFNQPQISAPSTTTSIMDPQILKYQTWPGCYVPNRVSPCLPNERRQQGSQWISCEMEESDEAKEGVEDEQEEIRSYWSDSSSDDTKEKTGFQWRPPLRRKVVRSRLDWLCGPV